MKIDLRYGGTVAYTYSARHNVLWSRYFSHRFEF